ncbi:MAG: SAM-dependent methyltransferase [Planctomycetota bacterium]|jgi:23S rRNA (cytidine2498-2'-O)-methyltransferase
MPAPNMPVSSLSPIVRGGFILCPCHPGAEAALAARQADVLPAFSRGVWRRGAATFRIGPEGFDPPDDFAPDLIFAHTVVRSLGQVSAGSVADLAAKTSAVVGPVSWDAIHVWKREERLDVVVADARAAIAAACGVAVPDDPAAQPGDLVLDCVLDSADRWWVGWHRAAFPASRWPGGGYPQPLPGDKVSRAWLKLDEAIASFGITLQRGERAIELGAAPGGACQRLLEAGLDVIGVDAAMVDATVAAHPRFEQWRMRAREVPLKRMKGVDWLLTDMNIDPSSTMAALERVLGGGVRPAGVIATLKLPDWSRAADLPGWLDAFRAWGYVPRVRQLSTGGREVCVVATARPAGRVTPPNRHRATRRPGA